MKPIPLLTPTQLKNFEKKYIIDLETGCWNWIATKTKDGYGHFWLTTSNFYAHRITYTIYKKKIAEGLIIDHLCRNKLCVNPEHLEEVTYQENVRRGLASGMSNHFGQKQRAKTHCPEGHEYNEENTYNHKGWRDCKLCRREAKLRFKFRKKKTT